MKHPPHVLVTNDDGIDAPGLIALARTACDQGYDVTVAAPHRQASGTAGGLTMFPVDGRIEVRHRRLPGLPGVEAYAVAAHPGMIALTAMLGRFGPTPDLVLSGINEGSNLGAAVLHSGTVGAAIVAGAHGVTALAASLHLDFELDEAPTDNPSRHWDTAAAVVGAILPNIVRADAGSVFNLNVPNLPIEDTQPLVAAPWTLAGTAPGWTARPTGGRSSPFVGSVPQPLCRLSARRPVRNEVVGPQTAITARIADTISGR